MNDAESIYIIYISSPLSLNQLVYDIHISQKILIKAHQFNWNLLIKSNEKHMFMDVHICIDLSLHLVN